MKRLIFATGNQAKIEDAITALSELGIEVVGQKIDFEEWQSLSQEDIVRHKARQAYRKLKLPLVVDDTAFFIDSYPQFPGTLTKHVNATLGLSGLTKLFDEGQTAYFKTLLCFVDGEHEVVAEGVLSGTLTKNISEDINRDTPLNSIFIPQGYDRPLIELAGHSGIGNIHRTNAFKDLSKKMVQLKIADRND